MPLDNRITALQLLQPSILLAIVLILGTWCCGAVAQRNVVVRISITDYISNSPAFFRSSGRAIQQILPTHTLMNAETYAVRFNFNDQLIRQEIVKKIKNLDLREGDQITHLELSTHGASNDTTTVLEFLGAYAASGPDERLIEILEPLLPYVSSDLMVIQSACSTFCGSEASIVARALPLLRYLGAERGSIYGALTNEYNPAFPSIPAIVSGALFSVLAYTHDSSLAVLALATQIPLVSRLLTRFEGRLNRGSIIQIKAEDVLTSVSRIAVDRNKDFYFPYKVKTCEEALTTSHN